MSPGTALVCGPDIARYGFGGGHQFGPDRHDAFMRELLASDVAREVKQLAPRSASEDELASFHTRGFLDFARERCEAGIGFLDAGDTPAQRGIYDAAVSVVG